MKKIFETMRGHLLRRVIFVLCALVIGITSSAQARIGFTAGVDINYPLTDALYQRPAPGYSLGIVGEYLFSNGFGINVATEMDTSGLPFGLFGIDQNVSITFCAVSTIPLISSIVSPGRPIIK
mgnify:CR=1 FL=1